LPAPLKERNVRAVAGKEGANPKTATVVRAKLKGDRVGDFISIDKVLDCPQDKFVLEILSASRFSQRN
jgi:hypothetical protein